MPSNIQTGSLYFAHLFQNFNNKSAIEVSKTFPRFSSFRVSHLILADPWGFPEPPKEGKSNIPMVYRVIGSVLSRMNPLWAVRFAGPFGQYN